jgi:hypothetical protein
VGARGDRRSTGCLNLALHKTSTAPNATLELDLKYWPTFSLSRGEDGEWAREAIGDQPAA